MGHVSSCFLSSHLLISGHLLAVKVIVLGGVVHDLFDLGAAAAWRSSHAGRACRHTETGHTDRPNQHATLGPNGTDLLTSPSKHRQSVPKSGPIVLSMYGDNRQMTWLEPTFIVSSLSPLGQNAPLLKSPARDEAGPHAVVPLPPGLPPGGKHRKHTSMDIALTGAPLVLGPLIGIGRKAIRGITEVFFSSNTKW